jgi:orotidine-5'-phosphate decarboxylase
MRSGKARIIFPLDVASLTAAEAYVEMLKDAVGMFKVGLELFITAGPAIMTAIRRQSSAGIFLDLKLHDIPATVQRAMARVVDLGVAMATVHCGENTAMLEAAVDGAQGKVALLGVTVLTSVSAGDVAQAGYQSAYADDLSALVMKRAAMAQAAGFAGVICSGLEAARIKQAFGEAFLSVTPGIRPAWEKVKMGDQKRVLTPAQAIREGADYLVIGRPIRDAADPRQAALDIAAEIEAEA